MPIEPTSAAPRGCTMAERLAACGAGLPSTHQTFALGQRVRKRNGSSWQGRVCGWYSTNLTSEGYAVESEREPGSVQIYPAAALEQVPSKA